MENAMESKPVSFTGTVFTMMADRDSIVNPQNRTDQSAVGKIARFVLRYFISAFVTTFLAPVGALCHLGLAGANEIASLVKSDATEKLHLKERAFQHLDASGRDLIGALFGLRIILSAAPIPGARVHSLVCGGLGYACAPDRFTRLFNPDFQVRDTVHA